MFGLTLEDDLDKACKGNITSIGHWRRFSTRASNGKGGEGGTDGRELTKLGCYDE